MSTQKCERITRREQRIARTRANALLQGMRKELRGEYRMTFRIAGSGCWGTMVSKPDGSYDLDYQIFITRNSKEYETAMKDPKKLKNRIRGAFDGMRNESESFEDSTTAITLTNSQGSVHYSIDFVIITEIDGRANIIRQDKKSRPPSYTWNQLPQKYDGSYRYFRSLGSEEKRIIVDRVIERKCKEMHKSVRDKSSSEIMIEEINRYADGKGVHL